MKGTAIPAMPTTSLTQVKTTPPSPHGGLSLVSPEIEALAYLYGRGAHFVLLRSKKPIWKRYQYLRNRPTLGLTVIDVGQWDASGQARFEADYPPILSYRTPCGWHLLYRSGGQHYRQLNGCRLDFYSLKWTCGPPAPAS